MRLLEQIRTRVRQCSEARVPTLVLVSSLVASSCSPPPPDEFSAYPIYSAVLDSFAGTAEFSHVKRVLLFEQTKDLTGEAGAAVHVGDMDVPTIMMRAYQRANVDRIALVDSFETSLAIDFLPPERDIRETEEDNLDGWWQGLAADFAPPVYIFEFSRPGFSHDGRVAFVHYSYHCGPLCGEGRVTLVEQSAGRWIVVDEYGLWIS